MTLSPCPVSPIGFSEAKPRKSVLHMKLIHPRVLTFPPNTNFLP